MSGDVRYASIEPLLTGAHERGDQLHCTFTCPASGREVHAVGPLRRGRGLADVSAEEQGGLLGSLKSALGGLFSSVLGGGAEAAAGGGAVSAPEDSPYSEDERKAAVYLAFETVAPCFVRERRTRRWISAESAAELLSPFARQLLVAPVREERDREVLSRILVEIARADGRVTPSEWAFLASFIPGDLASVDTNMELPALTPADLDRASPGPTRETILMLAWALALSDGELDRAEVEEEFEYAEGLKVPRERALELREAARSHLFEDALHRAYRSGERSARGYAKALELAKALGLSDEARQAVETRYLRREGRAPAP